MLFWANQVKYICEFLGHACELGKKNIIFFYREVN